MKPRTPKCILGRTVPTEMDAEAVKRQGWQDQRILVVRLDDPRLDFVLRQMVQTLGDTLYGRH